MHDPFHVRQSRVSAGVAIGQTLVIEPEQVENLGVLCVLNGLVTKFDRLAVCNYRFDTTTSHPEAESLMIVVATVGVLTVGLSGLDNPVPLSPHSQTDRRSQPLVFHSKARTETDSFIIGL